MTEILTTLTDRERWDAALKDLRKVVKTRVNVRACCRGCITDEQLGFDTKTEPYAIHFGGQGDAYSWFRGVMVYRADVSRWNKRCFGKFSGDAAGEIYFMHGNGSGETIARIFREHGFEVEWDGTENKTVIVKMPVPADNSWKG